MILKEKSDKIFMRIDKSFQIFSLSGALRVLRNYSLCGCTVRMSECNTLILRRTHEPCSLLIVHFHVLQHPPTNFHVSFRNVCGGNNGPTAPQHGVVEAASTR